MISVLLMQTDDTKQLWSLWTNPNSNIGPVGIFIAVLSVVVLGVFFWAAFVRKPRKRLHSYDHNGSQSRRRKSKSEVDDDQPSERRRRRRRRHHRDHEKRPLNPTLAQVGGLPQPRQDKPPGP